MALSADGSLSTCCSTIQRQLLALNAPKHNELRSYGLINALESPQNLAGVDQGIADNYKHFGEREQLTMLMQLVNSKYGLKNCMRNCN
ncbi:MAG: hypothetical protein IPI96_15725 [Saprospiraceae bacterium]|nr:hypothetical protein [Saprospiraceae bacterium]